MTDRRQFTQQVQDLTGGATWEEAVRLADTLIERGYVKYDERAGYDIDLMRDMTDDELFALLEEEG